MNKAEQERQARISTRIYLVQATVIIVGAAVFLTIWGLTGHPAHGVNCP
jgi:hypothetical protein